MGLFRCSVSPHSSAERRSWVSKDECRHNTPLTPRTGCACGHQPTLTTYSTSYLGLLNFARKLRRSTQCVRRVASRAQTPTAAGTSTSHRRSGITSGGRAEDDRNRQRYWTHEPDETEWTQTGDCQQQRHGRRGVEGVGWGEIGGNE